MLNFLHLKTNPYRNKSIQNIKCKIVYQCATIFVLGNLLVSLTFDISPQQNPTKPKPINLKYIDVSNNPSHYKALDIHGKEGYVHNATYLSINPPTFPFDEGKQCRTNGDDTDILMLKNKVQVRNITHHKSPLDADNSLKLFCAVYTTHKRHKYYIQPVLETWGPKCDGFMVASTLTEPLRATANIPHEGPENYYNIWQKTRSNLAFIYDNYYNEYDWFHFGGDDMYVIVENLRYYLESDEIKLAAKGGSMDVVPEGSEIPLYLGRRFAEQGNMNRIFNSGGPGYTLNEAALKLLVTVAFPTCNVDKRTFAEDVMVAECFRRYGVFPYETKDEFGGERYMPFTPGRHYTYKMPETIQKGVDWYAMYSIDIKEGLDHCSSNSIAFHYVKPDAMRKMHAVLYNYCP